MTKDKLTEILEALKAKQNGMKKVLRGETLIESRAHIERQISTINSICDRLTFNFNMLPNPQAKEFLSNTIAEAELWIAG